VLLKGQFHKRSKLNFASDFSFFRILKGGSENHSPFSRKQKISRNFAVTGNLKNLSAQFLQKSPMFYLKPHNVAKSFFNYFFCKLWISWKCWVFNLFNFRIIFFILRQNLPFIILWNLSNNYHARKFFTEFSLFLQTSFLQNLSFASNVKKNFPSLFIPLYSMSFFSRE
jgi:hypothetical protein